jgi:homoserine acetyltransferase
MGLRADWPATQPNGQVAIRVGSDNTGCEQLQQAGVEKRVLDGSSIQRAERLSEQCAERQFDANDVLYQWESSRDYNPAPGLERIQAVLLAINAPDDERNPPETGIMERELKRVKTARLFLIPASEDTRGHQTTSAFSKLWKNQLQELLATAPRRQM